MDPGGPPRAGRRPERATGRELCRRREEPVGQYLAFLGRLAPDKGPEAAIRIARIAGIARFFLFRWQRIYLVPLTEPLLRRANVICDVAP